MLTTKRLLTECMNELIGQHIVSGEVFEPWCSDLGTGTDEAFICGALALHTHEMVLTISSRARFSSQVDGTRSALGLHLSAMDRDTWHSQRDRWLEHSRLYSPLREVTVYRTDSDANRAGKPSPLASYLKSKISAVCRSPHDQDREEVTITFMEHLPSLTLQYLPDHDGGIGWVSRPDQKMLARKLSPTGEFAWLHPKTPIPVQLGAHTLRSALFEDWPLFLRRTILARQELPSGEPLRRGAQLLEAPGLRDAYLKVVCTLMTLRFEQHRLLRWRLANLNVPVTTDDEFGPMLNESLPRWKARFA